MLTLLGGLVYMAIVQNLQEAKSERSIIALGLETMAQSVAKTTKDYGFWTEFYTHAKAGDIAWTKDNVASGVYATHVADFLAIYDGDTNLYAAWDTDHGESLIVDQVDHQLSSLVKTQVSAMAERGAAPWTGYMRLNGKMAVVAFTRIGPTEASDLFAGGAKSVLVMAYYLHEERLNELGRRLLIGDLKLDINPTGSLMPLMDPEGSVIGGLTWTPAKPGTLTLMRVLLPVSAITALLAGLAIFSSLHARRQAVIIEASEVAARQHTIAMQGELMKREHLAQLGTLTATVAHEIRNPLGVVRTSAFLLRRKVADRNLGLETQLQRIDNGVSRCDAIINQLIDFARSGELEQAPVEMDNWIERVVIEEAVRIPDFIRIACDLALGNQTMAIDAQQMQRVIANLMTNAMEAIQTSCNFAGASETTPDHKITIASRLTSRGVEIRIADTGSGIAPEVKDKILTPMFTTKSFGTGLGLSASYNILERHGGGLDFENLPEGGACFTVWLPNSLAAENMRDGVADHIFLRDSQNRAAA